MAGHAELEDRKGDRQDEPGAAKRCTEVRPGGDLAVARFADGSEVEADVIVGADGIHSPVRACLFGPDAPRFTGKICYCSVIPAGAAWRRDLLIA